MSLLDSGVLPRRGEGAGAPPVPPPASPSLFFRLPHPFAWTVADDRPAVLRNVEEPLWHRFLTEAEAHFAGKGELVPPVFPLNNHDGDLDEVMALAVLATVRPRAAWWAWIAEWLRGLAAYHRRMVPTWRERTNQILRGGPVPTGSNPFQFFDGFVAGGNYFVEGGVLSTFLHLYDLLEAEAPGALSPDDKRGLEAAIASFAERYAFHEEALKYSNRGLWANVGMLAAAIVHGDAQAGRLLLYQAGQRHRQFRSTFLDDGMHAEGSAGYHDMAMTGLFNYALTASRVDPETDYWGATASDPSDPYAGAPALETLVKAYVATVVPGPVLRRNPRGASLYTPVECSPPLVAAAARSRDPELAWIVAATQDRVIAGLPTPLKVTPAALLGLNHYTPLINFWLCRPLARPKPPGPGLRVLRDHGSAFSRSGSGPGDSLVWARFGFQGTGKGHRDMSHLAIVAGGRDILSDPFPLFGPEGNDGALFHNVVIADRAEPPPTVGILAASASRPGIDAFLTRNHGGKPPARAYLHDPREEANYFFTCRPVEEPPLRLARAVVHLHRRAVLVVDEARVSGAGPDRDALLDWFFHTPRRPAAFDPGAAPESEPYVRLRATRLHDDRPGRVEVRGGAVPLPRGAWSDFPLDPEGGAALRMVGLDADFSLQAGLRSFAAPASRYFYSSARGDRERTIVEDAYFLRFRTRGSRVRAAWLFTWGEPNAGAVEARAGIDGDRVWARLDGKWRIAIDFAEGRIAVDAAPEDGA